MLVWRIELLVSVKKNKSIVRDCHRINSPWSLVLLLLNMNQNEMKVLCIFYDIKYVAGIFYSIYILSTLRLKSTSSRKCKDDCVSEEKIRISLKIFERLKPEQFSF